MNAKDYQGEAWELAKKAANQILRGFDENAASTHIETEMLKAIPLASLLEARDQLEELLRCFSLNIRTIPITTFTVDSAKSALCLLAQERDALRQSSGALYNWIQGNVTIDERTRDVMNRLYEELDKGMKDECAESTKWMNWCMEAQKVATQLRTENEALRSQVEQLHKDYAKLKDTAYPGEL